MTGCCCSLQTIGSSLPNPSRTVAASPPASRESLHIFEAKIAPFQASHCQAPTPFQQLLLNSSSRRVRVPTFLLSPVRHFPDAVLVLLQVRAAVAKHLRHNPDAEILITGHSLGGALATLCFLDLQLTLGGVPVAPVYIFGAPRVRVYRSLCPLLGTIHVHRTDVQQQQHAKMALCAPFWHLVVFAISKLRILRSAHQACVES